MQLIVHMKRQGMGELPRVTCTLKVTANGVDNNDSVRVTIGSVKCDDANGVTFVSEGIELLTHDNITISILLCVVDTIAY